MTTLTQDSSEDHSPKTDNVFWRFINRIPGVKAFKNLSIGARLTIGFGILVLLTLLGAAFSYVGSNQATTNIARTSEVRVPTALVASRAQADLLRMLGNVRGYLALGNPEFRERYFQSRQSFEANMARLEALSPNLNQENRQRLVELRITFEEWSTLPEQLFELRNDQLEREPAYKLLATDGVKKAGELLIDVRTLVELQAQREPIAQNLEVLEDMANFQGSSAAMLSGLRGYVTTRNRIFRGEYEANFDLNEIAWERLLRAKNSLTPNQQTLLDEIAQNRADFLLLPDQMFEILESERWREDLYLFSTEAVPLTEKMESRLSELTDDQQVTLLTELDAGRRDLARANQRILISGIVAIILGVALTFIFRENIAGPVRRLTRVAEQVREGDLETQAQVESDDEIGTLAETFNEMTSQLRQTLIQVRKEKKRADDLLDVVIPIGVELASEKDFNRLLESMMLEAKSFCNADAGVLYWRTEDDRLEFFIVRNDTLKIQMGGTSGNDVTYTKLMLPLPMYDQTTGEPNHDTIATRVALTGQSVNIAHADRAPNPDFADPKVFSDRTGYNSVSHLTIPLKSTQDHVVGVLQLINAQDPETGQIIPFDQNLQRMMESFSSLAVAALEAYIREQQLKQEIQQLRIEIDDVKRQQQVEEITETDFFRDLKSKAQEIRQRSRRTRGDEPEESES